MKKIIICLLLSSFIGAGILAVDVGIFNITLFKICLVLCLAGFLFHSLMNMKLSLPKMNHFYILFSISWFFYSLLSGFWVKDYRNWIRYNYYLFIFILFLMLFIKYFNDFNDIRKIFRALFILMIVLNCVGWLEVVFQLYLFSDNTTSVMSIAISRRNPIGFTSNPNDFALAMLFGFFLTYSVEGNLKKKLLKWLNIILRISCLLLIVFSESRSVLVGLGIGFLWLLLLKLKKTDNKYIFYGLFIIPLGTLFLLQSVDFDFSMSDMNSESIRINLIRNGFYFLKQTWGFGVGAGNVEYWMQNYPKYNTASAINMHNWWIEILVCYGFLIFALYLYFYIRLLFSFYNKYKSKIYRKYEESIIGITGFMVSFLIGSVGSSSLFSSLWLWAVWALFIVYDIQLAKQKINLV